MSSAPQICAFTSVCDEDHSWFRQYVVEAERLGIPYVIHLDRCVGDLHKVLTTHPLCVGTTSQRVPREFRENDKQGALDLVSSLGFDWAMSWDVDETYEKEAASKIRTQLAEIRGHGMVWWVNLWGSPEFIRTDGPFTKKPRGRFYDLKQHRWRFKDQVTNGPYPTPKEHGIHQLDIVCLHWGMMTRELRLLHKARWDRIYTAAAGRNPYGFWDYAVDEQKYPPTIEPNVYL